MKETAHSRIEKSLRQRIRSLPPGSKIPTEMELCGEYAVSRMTMNKVFERLVHDDLLYRVKKRGTFVKERRTSQRPIYFLLPVVDYLTYDSSITHKRVLAGLNREAALFNRRVEFLPVTRTNIRNDYDWERLEQISRGDQVFSMGYWYRQLFPFLHERECEVVCINLGVWLEDEYKKIISDWYLISLERKVGVENAVLQLARAGKRRPLLLYAYEEREHPVNDGYASGLKKAGLKFSKELSVYLGDSTQRQMETCSSVGALHQKRGFDSVILALPALAKTVIEVLRKTGSRIPDDIALICLEEYASLTETEPPVTSMASPYCEAGREAARIFNREVFLPGETRLRQVLIERESSRKGAGNIIDPEYLPELDVDGTMLNPLMKALA